MGVLDKIKATAARATTKAQEGVATVQTKRELTKAYGELGQTSYELVQSGELTHQRGVDAHAGGSRARLGLARCSLARLGH